MSEADVENRAELLAERIGRLSADRRALLQRRRAAQQSDGHDLVAMALAECGITHVYGVAGRPTEEVLPACDRRSIRPIGVYHQSSAVCMATAHNYQAGGVAAAALLSAGPAVTNSLTGLMVAYDNGWPVIVLGGQRTSFQKSNVLPMVRHMAKHATRVSETGAIRETIRSACRIAVSGRPGPVYVELHEDILSGKADRSVPHVANKLQAAEPPPLASDREIDTVAAALCSARRPALLLGKGVRWSVASQDLRELVERIGLPFITSPMGRGFLPDDHAFCCNTARSVLQSQADVVLVLGARLNWVFRHGTELSRQARIFRVDIRDDDTDESAVHTELILNDAGDFVSRLLRSLKRRAGRLHDESRLGSLADWHDRLRTASQKTRLGLEQRADDDRRPMSPYRMMRGIRDALPRNAVCITEGNISMGAAQQVIPAFQPASRMDAGTNACMGVGIPFAIGAKLARPHQPVVAIVGDYGFSLTAMELEVCVRHNIPIVVVVANNQGNNGALKQKSFFPEPSSERVTMFQPGLEYDRLMAMFGGAGSTVAEPDRLTPAVHEALAENRPCCINVVIDPESPLTNAWGEQNPDEGAVR